MNKNKKILIIVSILLIGIIGIVSFLFLSDSGKDLVDKPKNNIKKTEKIEPIVDVDKATEKIFLDKEIQRKIDSLQKVLKPNYLKVVDFQESKNLLGYTDPQVTWYVMVVDYDINPKSMADYDININKGSLSELDFKKKSALYKENLKRKMLNIYYPAYNYDRLKKIGFLGYIAKEGDVYTMYPLGDYLVNTFSTGNINVETKAKLSILADYFNYFPIFFNKEPKEIRKLLLEVKKELNNKKFDKFADVLDKIYFSDLKRKI